MALETNLIPKPVNIKAHSNDRRNKKKKRIFGRPKFWYNTKPISQQKTSIASTQPRGRNYIQKTCKIKENENNNTGNKDERTQTGTKSYIQTDETTHRAGPTKTLTTERN